MSSSANKSCYKSLYTSSKSHGQEELVRKSSPLCSEKTVCSKCKIIQKENTSLKKELSELKCQYTQLIQETSHEKFSERRVNLLKAQVLQLERQVILLSHAINSRSILLSQLQIMTINMEQKINDMIGQCKPEPANQITLQLQSLLMDIKCFSKSTVSVDKTCNEESLVCLIPYTGRYLEKNSSILDTLKRGNIHFNHTSWLEGQLSTVRYHLIQLHSSLKIIPSVNTPTLSSIDPLYAVITRVGKQAVVCIEELTQVCQELMTFSLLVPGQIPQDSKTKRHVNIDELLKELPPFLRNKQLGKDLLQVVIGSLNQEYDRLSCQVKILEEALDAHKNDYQKHVEYIETILKTISEEYRGFIQSVYDTLVKPLQEITDCYKSYMRDGSAQNIIQCLDRNIGLLQETMDRINEITKNKNDKDILNLKSVGRGR